MFEKNLEHMWHRQIILQSHFPSILCKLGRKVHCHQIYFQVDIRLSSRRCSLSPTVMIIGGHGGNSPASMTGDTYIGTFQFQVIYQWMKWNVRVEMVSWYGRRPCLTWS